jgi:hypothetical protein
MNVSKGQSRPTLEDAFDALRRSEAQLRTFIDELPALAWCLLPDAKAVVAASLRPIMRATAKNPRTGDSLLTGRLDRHQDLSECSEGIG